MSRLLLAALDFRERAWLTKQLRAVAYAHGTTALPGTNEPRARSFEPDSEHIAQSHEEAGYSSGIALNELGTAKYPETGPTLLRRTVRFIMAKPQKTDGTSEPAPDLLAQLEQIFGWGEAQAIDALGAYMLSTEAGRALRRALAACNRTERAA